MDIVLKIDGKELAINENQLNISGINFTNSQKDEINRLFDWKELTEKTVTDLNGYSFYVKDYQRGYRWTQSEVEALLDDIAETGNNKYCMQPLVIRRIKSEDAESKRWLHNGEIDKFTNPNQVLEYYEVIDGQQRLTTMHLILNTLFKDLNDVDYSIYYEQFRTVDEKYLEKAKETINNWFKSKEEVIELQTFLHTLKSKLFFIWYEIGDAQGSEQKSSEDIFNNVNAGKIELTNAELFRALLLKKDDMADDNKKREIEQIAFEWDEIEKGLQNNEFWYFVAGDTNKSTTRIDYILELYARKVKIDELLKSNSNNKKYTIADAQKQTRKLLNDDERFSFNVVKSQLNIIDEESKNISSIDVWKEITGVYENLYTWFLDDTLYHLIGFLVRCEEEEKKAGKGLTADIIFDLYSNEELKTKTEMKQYLWQKVCDRIYGKKGENNDKKTASNHITNIEDVTYSEEREKKYTKKIIRACLLFFNIWSCIQGETHSRFSFYLYKKEKWDIEHINPQTLIAKLENVTQDDKKTFCQYLKNYAEHLRGNSEEPINDDETLGRKLLEKIESLEKSNKSYDDIWSQCAKIINETDINDDISNLTLLSAKINRSYGNAFFLKKREKIIDFDRNGDFIPTCTKNVFLKYYSETDLDAVAWTPINKKDYLKALKRCFLGLKVYAQKGDDFNE